MQSVTIHGEIPVKKNSYRIAGNRLVKPAEIKAFEQLVATAVLGMKAVRGKFEFDVELVVAKDRDLDGAVTTLLDALQDAGLYENDAKCVRISAEKKYADDPKLTGAVVRITEL